MSGSDRANIDLMSSANRTAAPYTLYPIPWSYSARFMSRVCIGFFMGLGTALSCAIPLYGQYPGRVASTQPTGTTHLRATAVLEFTGELTKDLGPNRLVPIAVWDGTQYQPGALYLAQPAPLAVLGGTQYQLESDGKSQGFFDVKDSENLAGGWVGVGHYEPPPAPRLAAKANSGHVYQVKDNSDPDKPHFAHRPEPDTQNQTQNASPNSTAAKSDKSANSGPTLHPRANSGDTASTASEQPQEVDPDRPTFHRRETQTATNSMAVDPDRPHLGYTTPESQEKLQKPNALFGMPADMKQVAGVSDSNALDTESFAFSWANPDDAQKMEDALQKAAEQAIGPVKPAAPHSSAPATSPKPTPEPDQPETPGQRPSLQAGRPSLDAGRPASQPAPSSTQLGPSSAPSAPPASQRARHRTTRTSATQKALAPVLQDVQFKVYSLSFGGGSTMVYSARSASDPEKYVTIIAQPDFYGNAQVLLKHVASGDNLDAIPRMWLIDAVDTQGDGRGDLIFELRGQTYRQFAIYRVSGGQATQVFVTQPTPLS